MTTSYPGSLDALTNPLSTDTMDSPDHATQHANANDAIEAIEVAVGLSGTSFPASPTSGAKFYRTDRNLLYFYDGTLWLTTTLYELPVAPGDVLFPNTNSPVTIGRLVKPKDYDRYVIDAQITAFIATTNNGSNYWTFELLKITSPNTQTSLGTANTSSSSADGYHTYIITVGAQAGTTAEHFSVTATKTGAPGAVYATSLIRYRLVG